MGEEESARGSDRGRWLLPAAAGVLLAGLLVALLVAAPERSLRREHDLLMRMRQRAAVATLEIEPVGEIRMFLNPDDRVITPSVIFYGEWEPKETLWFTRCVKPGDTVVDVGANVGHYTLLAAKLVGEQGRVFAFEPDPVSFALLERNVRLNGLRNVVLERKAVSNAPGRLLLYVAAENKGDHRIYQPSDEERESVEVEAVTLDDYFAGDPRGVDFVKIDTQGAEVVILEGMQRMLRENRDLHLAVEYWPWGLADFGTRAERLLELLHGFRYFNLAGPAAGPLREIDAPRLLERYSVQDRSHTNILAVRGAKGIAELQSHGVLFLKPEALRPPQ